MLYLSILLYVQNPIIGDSPKLIRSQRHHVITSLGADEHVHAIHQLVHLACHRSEISPVVARYPAW